MLLFANANLVLFSMPKTGSTAYHSLLRNKADIAFSGRQDCKHMNVRRYERFIAPYVNEVLKAQPETVAVMRDPLAHLGSWFRYRQRPSIKSSPKSTAGISFDEFLLAYMRNKNRPALANVGSQFGFVSTSRGEIGVTHLFAYEKGDLLSKFLQKRLKTDCTTEMLNISPKIELTVKPEIEEQLRKHLAKDFALHARILDAGGYLFTKKN